MGNCFGIFKKSTSDIAPSDDLKARPVVRLYGPPAGFATSFVRFVLLYKPVTILFIPSETPRGGGETPVLQCGNEIVSGAGETLLQYVEATFPDPPVMRMSHGWLDETTPLVVTVAVLQHRSMTWHMERLVRWAQDLAARGGRTRRGGDPVMGSPRMEVKKFGRSYGQLLELMLEHAQMEETVVFPILEKADPGLCKTANKEHARDLPMMNGIKEDIKSIGVLDSGDAVYQEAVCNLSARLQKLLDHCKEHFVEEEREVLPLMEAAVELSRDQQEKVLEQCFAAMKGTHSHLFPFFVQGLLPRDAVHYLDLLVRATGDKDRVASMLRMLFEQDRSIRSDPIL
ncbi:uncharacterized protein LOC127789777 [Diospyros lotus]|uniref:uncharacterized protein LOC127789777 n=1 Tax=Diospyros lotus TaxID=55363 RepID=UPI00224F9E18|nr:uncharacterized protein LOC127789777 [Diospyros lotus]